MATSSATAASASKITYHWTCGRVSIPSRPNSFGIAPKHPSSFNRKLSRRLSSSVVGRRVLLVTSETMTNSIEKSGIKIIKNPPESKLTDLGVRSWPKWGCDPSKFPWTYSSRETCFLLKGKVKVYPDGCDEAVEIGAGDLVEFPKGMSCTWDVSETVDKHYKFD
ncbi:hypothetical protein M9H77_00076 [Catharanthus roseus]|nr:hypothetical protein M9H77_00076 [Catharanthus roseus]